MKNIAKALLNAQKKIKNAHKDASNPHFKNKYATLESVLDAVKDIANSEGIVIHQSLGKDDMGQFEKTTLIHAESGEFLDSKVYLVLDKQNMQGLGSAITYSRRYNAAAAFFITQEDDDGNGASINLSVPKQKQEPIASGPSPYEAFTARQEAVESIKDEDWKVPFGKKFKGIALGMLEDQDIADTIAYFHRDGKPLMGAAKEFEERGNRVIQRRRADVK